MLGEYSGSSRQVYKVQCILHRVNQIFTRCLGVEQGAGREREGDQALMGSQWESLGSWGRRSGFGWFVRRQRGHLRSRGHIDGWARHENCRMHAAGAEEP